MKRILVTAALAVLLGGCSAVSVERYRAETPLFSPARYLNGTLDAWGMVQDRSGLVTKRFHAVIAARWDGPRGVLEESFEWADGSRSQRTWTLQMLPDGRVSGRAEDVVGEAIGEVAGNAFHWRYVLAVPVDGKVWNLDVDDWMFQMDEKVMLNRSTLRKWGLDVGEVTLAFVKRGP
ncbi:DUF3833 domain-containing protein [Massilia sp. TS11]|uniref:DUF3833 domain-containing protein n=1 Tax=Massilia sp. TS11 TaxID=2908003 RepID=UPI001EDA13E2|nr:DUF3833 domain-containing protein [Massilia sp. TS11]MCG2585059.1 DUF3833 domain-containing protein [Massilia sp. TS11]